MIGLIADATEDVIELGAKEVHEIETLSQDNEKHYVFYKLEEEEQDKLVKKAFSIDQFQKL